MASNGNGKRRMGPPKGNQNRLTHGLVAFRNGVYRRTRRGRSLIDRRSTAGKNAVAIGDRLLADMGGEENCSTAKLMLIELVRRDTYLLDECDKRICKILYKAGAKEKEAAKLGRINNPKFIGVLYSYRSGIARNLASNLALLGLEKVPPKQKTLEEILSEESDESDESKPRNQ